MTEKIYTCNICKKKVKSLPIHKTKKDGIICSSEEVEKYLIP